MMSDQPMCPNCDNALRPSEVRPGRYFCECCSKLFDWPIQGDLVAARQARDQAMARAKSHADGDWLDWARARLRRVALAQYEFTADDLWADPRPVTHEPRALGPILVEGQKAGLCEATDNWVPSHLPQRHGRPIRVWRSLIKT